FAVATTISAGAGQRGGKSAADSPAQRPRAGVSEDLLAVVGYEKTLRDEPVRGLAIRRHVLLAAGPPGPQLLPRHLLRPAEEHAHRRGVRALRAHPPLFRRLAGRGAPAAPAVAQFAAHPLVVALYRVGG